MEGFGKQARGLVLQQCRNSGRAMQALSIVKPPSTAKETTRRTVTASQFLSDTLIAKDRVSPQVNPPACPREEAQCMLVQGHTEHSVRQAERLLRPEAAAPPVGPHDHTHWLQAWSQPEEVHIQPLVPHFLPCLVCTCMRSSSSAWGHEKVWNPLTCTASQW